MALPPANPARYARSVYLPALHLSELPVRLIIPLVRFVGRIRFFGVAFRGYRTPSASVSHLMSAEKNPFRIVSQDVFAGTMMARIITDPRAAPFCVSRPTRIGLVFSSERVHISQLDASSFTTSQETLKGER